MSEMKQTEKKEILHPLVTLDELAFDLGVILEFDVQLLTNLPKSKQHIEKEQHRKQQVESIESGHQSQEQKKYQSANKETEGAFGPFFLGHFSFLFIQRSMSFYSRRFGLLS
jgi:hypothetical protein